MYAKAEKTKENQSRAVANTIIQKGAESQQGFIFVDNRIKTNQQLKHSNLSSGVVQLESVDVRVTGITHLVKIAGRSIMKGIEGPEVTHGDKVVIDSKIKYRSRRGPNQENDPRDELGEHIYRWFKVISADDVSQEDDYFIRDGTFLTENIDDLGSRPTKIHKSHRVRGQSPFQQFKINERKTVWGKVVEVAPGIGVEVQSGQGDSYVDFICQQIQKIQGSEVGTALLHQFNPKRLGEPFRMVKDQEGPLKGITVLIGQPGNVKSTRLINTIEQGGYQKDGKKTWGNPENSIPRINFFDLPGYGKEEQIGTTSAVVTHRGVEKHRDFPKDVQSFDTVLFHELVHAYISQLGVARRLRSLGDNLTNTLPPLIGDPDSIEEQLVVGLAGGAGLYFSENRYRLEQRQQKRDTYLANKLDETSDKGDLITWLQGVNIQEALERAGLTRDQANFVSGGH
jgi:hypothetical protein